MSDAEVRRRMAAVAARISARANRQQVPGESQEIDITPMPKPANSAVPPTPWQDREPGEDREP